MGEPVKQMRRLVCKRLSSLEDLVLLFFSRWPEGKGGERVDYDTRCCRGHRFNQLI